MNVSLTSLIIMHIGVPFIWFAFIPIIIAAAVGFLAGYEREGKKDEARPEGNTDASWVITAIISAAALIFMFITFISENSVVLFFIGFAGMILSTGVSGWHAAKARPARFAVAMLPLVFFILTYSEEFKSMFKFNFG